MESASGPTESTQLSVVEQRRYALAVAGISLILFVFGYFLGHVGGANVDAARAAGNSKGLAVGAKQGRAAGYAAGYKKGYRTSYRAAYSKAKNGD